MNWVCRFDSPRKPQHRDLILESEIRVCPTKRVTSNKETSRKWLPGFTSPPCLLKRTVTAQLQHPTRRQIEFMVKRPLYSDRQARSYYRTHMTRFMVDKHLREMIHLSRRIVGARNGQAELQRWQQGWHKPAGSTSSRVGV